jgi:hypothetical protein
MQSFEQKFLQEAKEYLNLTPLDQCQHKVISALRKSCGELSEEDLAKLSVQLLNCQSKIEGRPTFTCTQDMTVAECTKPMDPHTWNTYHIISNRARSVCYVTQQQQFRQQTEAAVNLLSRSTLEQLKAMEHLSNSHVEIRNIANESIQGIRKEQEMLFEKQSEITSSQEVLREAINQNILKINSEWKSMQEDYNQLQNMTSNIKKQLESAKEMLIFQEDNRQESQKRTNSELDKLSVNIDNVWKRIDTSTNDLLTSLNDISQQYQQTIDNLNTINNTVVHILSLLDTMNNAVGVQLGWVIEALGGAQDGLHVLLAVVGHGIYLLMGCLVLLFLKAPWFSRLSLLVLVVVNLILETRGKYGLSLVQLSFTLLTIVIGDYGRLWYKYRKALSNPPRQSISSPSVANQPDDTSSSDISDNEINDLYEDIHKHNDCPPKFPPPSIPITLSPHKQNHTSISNIYKNDSGNRGNSVSGNHGNGKNKCSGLTRAGLPCRLNVNSASPYCFKHS